MRATVVLLLLFVGCERAEQAAPKPSMPASASAAPTTSDRVTASPRDELLQRTLELDALRPFWHTSRPDRAPLRVLVNDVTRHRPPLSMFGAPVAWVDHAPKGTPVFVFAKIEETPGRVALAFEYPIEGVVGHVVFEKAESGWSIAEKHVAER